ncbi:aspartate carbamoyltransferase [Candidatus Woesearchaeota archaeon]|nr:aspartate carbamoyltransferase [Candidatus Woesearchaeota archaeon]
MGFKNRDVISINDFSKQDILEVLDTAAEVEKNNQKYREALKGYILATLFFEPSTRTRFSFQAAMLRLGGQFIALSNPKSTSSMAKGETLYDTIKMVDGYCDIIAVRHPEVGSAKVAADATAKPVINCGDGAHEHPTQTFTDLYTIKKTFGKIDGLKVGFLGDLKYGRTVHSLASALSYFNPKFYFISPKTLSMPEEHLKELRAKNVEYEEDEDLLKVSKQLDVLYVTRIQKERFMNPEDYAKVKGIYKLKADFLNHAKKDLKILHPLPRVDEIDPELDKYAQSIYFQQAHNGLFVREALLGMLLGKIYKK